MVQLSKFAGSSLSKDRKVEDFQLDDFWIQQPATDSKQEAHKCCSFNIFHFVAIFLFTGALLLSIYRTRAENLESSELQLKFQEFNQKFKRVYGNFEEYESRFQIFKENLKKIEQLNSASPTTNFQVNQFTDRTDEELRHMLMAKKSLDVPNLSMKKSPSNFSNISFPEKCDWRDSGKVVRVKNQGECGSCWAFAIVAAVESQYAIRKGLLVELSEQELVDCDRIGQGCSGGDIGSALGYVYVNGLGTEVDYPYSAMKHDQCSITINSTRVYIDDNFKISPDEDIIADWVANVGPVSFVMSIHKSFSSYANGIYSPSEQECKNESLGFHAMAIIGYGQEKNQKYWIIKNSWGTNWGEQGYLKLARGTNACGMKDNVIAPMIF